MAKHAVDNTDPEAEIPADAQPAPGPDPESDKDREVPQDKEVLK